MSQQLLEAGAKLIAIMSRTKSACKINELDVDNNNENTSYVLSTAVDVKDMYDSLLATPSPTCSTCIIIVLNILC